MNKAILINEEHVFGGLPEALNKKTGIVYEVVKFSQNRRSNEVEIEYAKIYNQETFEAITEHAGLFKAKQDEMQALKVEYDRIVMELNDPADETMDEDEKATDEFKRKQNEDRLQELYKEGQVKKTELAEIPMPDSSAIRADTFILACESSKEMEKSCKKIDDCLMEKLGIKEYEFINGSGHSK